MMPSSHRLRVNTEPRLRVNGPVFVVSGPCVCLYVLCVLCQAISKGVRSVSS